MELNIKVIEASDLPKMDTIGLSDPFCKIELSTTKKVWKTKVIDKTLFPCWNETFCIPVTSSLSDVLTVTLIDHDTFKKDDVISSYTFNVRDFRPGKVIDKWYQFEASKNAPKGGNVHLVFHLTESGNIPFIET